ncbi:Cdc25 phosphatase Ibp1 [Elasticomyces elasticus]|nr:Cdc25 phosphatase Ibp1 [Elasticomyces elasticus]
MANISVASVPRMSRETLSTLVRSKSPALAVIDVRDSDYIGGHIIGCRNVPSSTLDYRLPELVRTLVDKEIVVFHCALSQQRGPSAALRYLREKERLGFPIAAANNQNAAAKPRESSISPQRVYVLDGGFVKWQELFGSDKNLTEDYQKDIWEEDY